MKNTKYLSRFIGTLIFLMCLTCLLGFARLTMNSPDEIRKKSDGLHIQWKDNTLTISGEDLPGKKMKLTYLEAFCKTGSTNRDWNDTKIPHETKLVFAGDNDKHIKLRTMVQPDIEVLHDISARNDEVEFDL